MSNIEDEELIREYKRPYSTQIELFRELAVNISNEEETHKYNSLAKEIVNKTDQKDVKLLLFEYAKRMANRGAFRSKTSITATFLKAMYVEANYRLTGDKKVSIEILNVKGTRDQIATEARNLTKGEKFYGTHIAARELERAEKYMAAQKRLINQLKTRNQAIDQKLKTATNSYNNLVNMFAEDSGLSPDETKQKIKEANKMSRIYEVEPLSKFIKNDEFRKDLAEFDAVGITKKGEILEGIRHPDTGVYAWIKPSSGLQTVLDKWGVVKSNRKTIGLNVNELEVAKKKAFISKDLKERFEDTVLSRKNGELTHKEFYIQLKSIKMEIKSQDKVVRKTVNQSIKMKM